jgi:hypothetical protein
VKFAWRYTRWMCSVAKPVAQTSCMEVLAWISMASDIRHIRPLSLQVRKNTSERREKGREPANLLLMICHNQLRAITVSLRLVCLNATGAICLSWLQGTTCFGSPVAGEWSGRLLSSLGSGLWRSCKYGTLRSSYSLYGNILSRN